jgi:flavin reductase (DIM6/NTAB) family NADH-FMN oxidoreductase RutF
MKIELQDLKMADTRYRVNLINSLAGYKQAVLVGTRSRQGQNNLAVFNSLMHIGADPALNGLLFRPHTVERHTLQNILDTGYYTINYPVASDFRKVHQTAAKYTRDVSEFDEVGFTCEYSNDFVPPFVKEAAIKVAMKMEQKIDIPINETLLLIGSIQSIWLKDEMLLNDGFITHEKGDILSVVGLDAYYQSAFLGRLTYPRPGEKPNFIS